VRQLRNKVMRLASCARQSLITEDDLFDDLPVPTPTSNRPAGKPQSLKTAIEELERRMMHEAIESLATISSKPRGCWA
jgi:transcriptional regulator with PAS, ATPase and Fis domain